MGLELFDEYAVDIMTGPEPFPWLEAVVLGVLFAAAISVTVLLRLYEQPAFWIAFVLAALSGGAGTP